MLYLIGLGLCGEKYITLQGKEILDSCSDIYIEEYTNQFLGNAAVLNAKKLSRKQVESDFLVREARDKDIALLIVGDPLSATTHLQLVKDCIDAGIKYHIVHNTSIITAVAIAGLSLYKYGRITTLCFPSTNWDPESPYEIIKANRDLGLHTLVLLDTKDGEEYMTCEQGYALLKEKGVINTDKLIFCYAIGGINQKIEYTVAPTGGGTPSCIIVPGKMDSKEKEFVGMWSK